MLPITLTAPLEADAEDRRTADGQWLLLLRLALPAGSSTGKPITVRASKPFGSGPAAAIACRARSRQLRRGVRVTLSGTALTWHRGVAHLHDVAELQTPDLATPHRGALDT